MKTTFEIETWVKNCENCMKLDYSKGKFYCTIYGPKAKDERDSIVEGVSNTLSQAIENAMIELRTKAPGKRPDTAKTDPVTGKGVIAPVASFVWNTVSTGNTAAATNAVKKAKAIHINNWGSRIAQVGDVYQDSSGYYFEWNGYNWIAIL